MTMRAELISLKSNDSYATLKAVYLEHRYSRIPVFDPAEKQILGIINMKDLLFQILETKPFHLKSLMTKCHSIQANQSLDLALEQFQKTQSHLFAVTSPNNNNIIGIITLEDVLEELVGEIYDEDDLTGFVKEIGHHMWIVHEAASTKAFFNKKLHLSTKSHEHELKLKDWFDHQKKVNQTVIYKNYAFRYGRKPKYFEVEALSPPSNNF